MVVSYHEVSYAEEAVQRGSLAVAASNGRDAVVMCVECPSEDDAGPDDEDTNTSEARQHLFEHDNPPAPCVSSPRIAYHLAIGFVVAFGCGACVTAVL